MILPDGVSLDWAGTIIVTVTIFIVGAIVSVVVAVVGWALKKLGESLVDLLIENKAQTQLLDAKLAKVIDTIGDVEKMRRDINLYYKELKDLKKEIHGKDA